MSFRMRLDELLSLFVPFEIWSLDLAVFRLIEPLAETEKMMSYGAEKEPDPPESPPIRSSKVQTQNTRYSVEIGRFQGRGSMGLAAKVRRIPWVHREGDMKNRDPPLSQEGQDHPRRGWTALNNNRCRDAPAIERQQRQSHVRHEVVGSK